MSWTEASRVGLAACAVVLTLQTVAHERLLPQRTQTAPQQTVQPAAQPVAGPSDAELIKQFDADRALEHIRRLSVDIGPRPAGSEQEREAAEYVARQLTGWSWDVQLQSGIPMPGTDLRTTNVLAHHPDDGQTPTIVVGAHMDSYCRDKISPGANDNASGVAVLLELARVFRGRPLQYRLQLAFFGAEEYSRQNRAVHHVGSNYYVAGLGERERSQIAAMLSVDMVGAGPKLRASRIGLGSDRARAWMLDSAGRLGLDMSTDTGHAWSDHEAFERAGVPSVWLTRMGSDPTWHTPRDRYERIGRSALLESGRVCVRFLLQAEAELSKVRTIQ